jgi:hypothetical protein
MERRLVLGYLATKNLPPKTAEVLMLEDELNYDTIEELINTLDEHNNPFTLYYPWSALSPSSGTTPDGEPISFEKPLRSNGWYLMNINVTDPTPGFYTLLYYNEFDSILRAYLFNLNISGDVTGFLIQIGLLCKYQKQYHYLEGFLFPIGLNPLNWSKAVVPVPKWSMNSWTMIEVPIAYPMASNLNVVNGEIIEGKYWSLYDDPSDPAEKNILLQIKVAPYLSQNLRGDVVGQAIGTAIEQATPLGASEYIKGIYEAMKDGKDVYKGASDVVDSIKEYLVDNKDDFDLTKGLAADLLNASTFSIAGALGLAGAAVSLVKTFAFPKGPLQMTIQLALEGKLNGEAFTELQFTTTEFYLPGRCSIKEAFNRNNVDRLPTGNQGAIDAKLPRYDRPVGLFGYSSDPSKILINIYKLRGPGYINYFVIPYCHNEPRIYEAKPCRANTIPPLPIIYNAYTGIDPLISDNMQNSDDTLTAIHLKRPTGCIYCKFFFDGNGIVFSLYDPTNEDMWNRLQYPTEAVDYNFHDSNKAYELFVRGQNWKPDSSNSDHNWMNTMNFGVHSIVWKQTTNNRDFHAIPDEIYMIGIWGNELAGENDWSIYNTPPILPLTNIIYYWKVVYEAKDRNGKFIKWAVANNSVAVSMAITEVHVDYPDANIISENNYQSTSYLIIPENLRKPKPTTIPQGAPG